MAEYAARRYLTELGWSEINGWWYHPYVDDGSVGALLFAAVRFSKSVIWERTEP